MFPGVVRARGLWFSYALASVELQPLREVPLAEVALLARRLVFSLLEERIKGNL